MFGLTLFGDPRPVDASRLPPNLPATYIELMTTWGPGRLCGIYELPDPTEDNGRFEFFQHQLRVHGPALRTRGHWASLTDGALETGRVLGIDRFGTALLAYDSRVLRLLTDGTVELIGTFDFAVKELFGRRAPNPHHLELDVPAVYVTAATPNPRVAFLAAVAAGNETLANAELQNVLAAEIDVYALLELAEQLAASADLAGEIRASYVDQCLRMARRRATKLVEHVPLREIHAALEAHGELTAALTAKLQVLARPAGIFVATFDPRESELLELLAQHPDDEAARLVYADHLEDRGDHARADALRTEGPPVPPLADARERGFIAPLNMQPVDGVALLASYVERWRTEDPATPIDDLVARIAALHPQARQGYAILLARLSRWAENEAQRHLEREIGDAWPLLALALRTNQLALRVIIATTARDAAPYVLSAMRTATDMDWTYRLELADAYPALAKLAPALVDEYVALLGGPEPPPRVLAARLLVDHGADDRVFTAYLEHFAETHPYSETAIKKRKKDPRVLPAILEQFAVEENRSLGEGGRKLSYTTAYGVLARYLSKLGNARGKDAAANYRRVKR